MCLSKEKGGLGIRSLSNLNKALLGKWNWRFSVEENAARRILINLKYGTEEGVGIARFQEVHMWLGFGRK